MNWNKKDILDALEFIDSLYIWFNGAYKFDKEHWAYSGQQNDYRTITEKILHELYIKGYIIFDSNNYYIHPCDDISLPRHCLSEKGKNLLKKLQNELTFSI